MKERGTSLTGQILVAVALLVIALVAVGLFLNLFAPKPYAAKLEPFRGYDPAPMQQAVSPQAVRATVDTLAGFGSRYLGQPGFYQTEEYLRSQFRAAGLQILEQELDTPSPHTLKAEVLSPAGAPLGITAYPFMPNHLQPMVTPPAGLTGELVLLNDEVMRNRPSFTGVIGLLDNAAKAPEGFNYDWIKYAQLGLSALVVTHPGGMDKIVWPSMLKMASLNPVNYVRLTASPEILKYAGQQVKLQVRTEYGRMPSRTLIAKLEAPEKAKEAVVVCTDYDAASLLPDRAPGYSQAISTAMTVNMARAFAGYKGQLRRDVIFVGLGSGTVAQDALNELLWAMGPSINPAARRPILTAAQADNDAALKLVQDVQTCFAEADFATDAMATGKKLASLPGPTRAFLEEQVKYVLNTLVFNLSEEMLQAKLVFERAGGKDLNSPEYAAYQAVKKRYDAAFSSAGYALAKLLTTKADFAQEYQLRDLLQKRFGDLQAYHENKKMRLEQAVAIHDLFRQYSSVLVVCPQLTTSPDHKLPETLSFSMGFDTKHGEQAQAFKNLLTDAVARLKADKQVTLDFVGKDQGAKVKGMTNNIPLDSALWAGYSYPAFSVVNGKGAYTEWADPVEHPTSRDVESIHYSLAVLGEATLSAALGNGRFINLTTARAPQDYYGRVYVSNVGESIIPNYPLRDALVSCRRWTAGLGWFPNRVLLADPYGRYDHRFSAGRMIPLNEWYYDPVAVGYGADGVIGYMKDDGLSAQSIYKSVKIPGNTVNSPVNVVTYRSTPVSVLDMINPQTFKPFSAAALISQKTLAGFSSSWVDIDDGICTTFVKPDERFHVTLKAGSPKNELVQVIRAFTLGTSLEEAERQQQVAALGKEIEGPGYLAADTPQLLNVPVEIAKSMISVNGKRLALADKYGMADDRTQKFQEKSVTLLKGAAAPGESVHAAVLQARDAATYATLNHPVLRQTISEAVVGILWYLGLLVPFVFFFEKLIFGFTDIRKQLVANLFIFLTVFGLLRLLHPAFMMLRSSTMILLGFLIFLFSAGITLLFWGKFQQNLEQIKQARGQVTAAEVNRMGVVGTAFMLGLNNMHRRKLRTGFTCATLVLLTFVMICFTSIRSDLVDQATAVGKAEFTGFLVKNEKFTPLSDAELFAMQTKYGEKYAVAPRIMYVGVEEWPANERNNPKLEMLYEAGPDQSRSLNADSLLQFSAKEPMAAHMKFLTPNCWFTPDQERAQAGDVPLIISDAMADKLGITPAMVQAGGLKVTLNSLKCVIQGIFDSAALNELTDLDGKTLLPFDITALATVNKVTDPNAGDLTAIAEDTDPRIDAAKVILAPARPLAMTVDTSKKILNSLAVVLPQGTTYKNAKAVIDDYLEESGKSTYYGLDNYAFLGKRARQATLLGSIDMLIPLIIAALTVLNTMKGSVYERRDEIFVYNAVGIAPRYIFFMFFAEAFVYAVVGSVLGYLISQGTGTLLTITGHTGGLNMTFTSATTVYASVAIAISVFVSTYYPAKSAMEIAAPADDAGWQLPEPEGDVVSFDLPFTFDYRDRIAILSFFQRYLVDHGEGSSGPFFAGRPEVGVCEWCDPLAEDGYIPMVAVSIWLKPFDLGVSQQVIISLPTDPQTKEYIANIRMIRMSGTLENWKRVNHGFVALLRQHFLYWRAVGPAERAAMFVESRQLLESSLGVKEGEHV